jgi:hypothetical protein
MQVASPFLLQSETDPIRVPIADEEQRLAGRERSQLDGCASSARTSEVGTACCDRGGAGQRAIS